MDRMGDIARKQIAAGGVPLAKPPVILPPDKRPVFKTFEPVGDWIAVRVHHISETSSGLHLPDGVDDPNSTPTCTIIAVGSACKHFTKDDEGRQLVVPNAQQGVRFVHGGSGPVVLFKEEMLCCGKELPVLEIETNRRVAEAKLESKSKKS